jgi:hypothetical protein
MTGVLHCSHCGDRIARWVNEDDLGEGEPDSKNLV